MEVVSFHTIALMMMLRGAKNGPTNLIPPTAQLKIMYTGCRANNHMKIPFWNGNTIPTWNGKVLHRMRNNDDAIDS